MGTGVESFVVEEGVVEGLHGVEVVVEVQRFVVAMLLDCERRNVLSKFGYTVFFKFIRITMLKDVVGLQG